MRAMIADTTLADAYAALRAAEPGLRTRDAATRLGVSEGVLAEARRGRGVRRLALRGGEFARVLEDLRIAGPVMTLTRNEAAVHETTGEIGALACDERMGQATGAIDLRMFFAHWHAGYEVAEETRSGLRRSVQVFDRYGTAVLKVFAVAETDGLAWERAVAAHEDRGEAIAAFAPPSPPAADPDDTEIDREALRRGWLALEHTHGFHALLRETGAGREQALRLVGEDLALRVDAGAAERVLAAAAETAVPVMCFVGNPGCLQIFTGPVGRVATVGPWLNVLDPGFNLHLRADLVASTWLVTKPTRLRGAITSLELFDAAGGLVCQLFGARDPGGEERAAWRELVRGAAEGRS